MKNICEKLFKTLCLLGCTFVFLVFHPHMLGSETLQITTYYPAPYGGYVKMLTTDQTVLARDGGRVGIGTSTPGRLLDVNGDMYLAGTLYGFCVTRTYSLGSNTACPGGYKLMQAQSSGSCIAIRDNSNRCVGYVCDATGTMICCRFNY